MHEWGLAEGVISTAIEVAKKEGLKEIDKIKIKMGELQQIDTEIFRFALKEIMQPLKNSKLTLKQVQGQNSKLLEKTKIEFKTEKAILKCKVCGHKWAFSDIELNDVESEAIHFIPEIAHVYIRCPECGSPDFEVVKGRGVFIESIEGMR